MHDLDGAEEVGAALVNGALAIADVVLAIPDAARRRHADVWSPLEYTAHLRDMLLVQRERVLLARQVDRPEVVAMGRDARVVLDDYASQGAESVSRQLVDAARMLAHTFAQLMGDDWHLTLVYQYPVPAERTLRWVAARTHHEVHHHLLDIRRQA